MPVPVVEYTPVTPADGRGHVHATTLTTPSRTACGRKFSGWVVGVKPLTCPECKKAVFFKVRGSVRR